MPRIELVSPDRLSPAQRVVYDAVLAGPRREIVGPLRAALHSPALAEHWQKLGAHLRYDSCVGKRLSELAILATARFWNSELEWFIHAEAGVAAGLDEAVIEAIRVAGPPQFHRQDEALVYEYSRNLLETGQVPDAVYGALQARHEPIWLVELTALIGYYTMVAMTLNAHHIPLPERDGSRLGPRAGGIAAPRLASAATLG